MNHSFADTCAHKDVLYTCSSLEKEGPLEGCYDWPSAKRKLLGYLTVRVHGDTIGVGHRFGRDQLLLLLHPAVHVRVVGLGPPPSEGLRGTLRSPLGGPLGGPWTSWAVWTLGETVGLMSRCGSFTPGSVSILGLTLSQQCPQAKAGLKGGLC